MNCELQDKVFEAASLDFNTLALEVFHFQFSQNSLYRNFCLALGIDPANIRSVASIPFLPVHFFKTHAVVAGSFEPQLVFESSGTTQTANSRHLVKDESLYRESFTRGFEFFYGPVREWCIIGLLPAYLERQNSSLVKMVHDLVADSGHTNSGFYLYDHDSLAGVLQRNEAAGQKTLLIGVTFALLDFAEKFRMPLHHTVVMETGGMKGRRKEITRDEVHALLKAAWQLPVIHSEYGMTELLSQAYSAGNGIFACPPWMKVLLRDEDDPLTVHLPGPAATLNGLINVIDLANLYSCSFIAIDDIGKLHSDGQFEVLGRMDTSDIRGCSLLYDY